MSVKSTYVYVCSACGHTHDTYVDLCNGCCEYKTLKKVTAAAAEKEYSERSAVTFSSLSDSELPPPVIRTGIEDIDRVFGNGFSVGSTVLFTGERGVGKTTLLLRVAAAFTRSGKACIYLSGEQAKSSLSQYAKRQGLGKVPITIATDVMSVESTLVALKKLDTLDVLIVDSLQSVAVRRYRSGPGSTTQVKASAEAFIRFARRHKVVLILVGHETKDKKAAGSAWVQHTVDVIVRLARHKKTGLLLFSCDGKNRYGPVDEIGLFRWRKNGRMEDASDEDRERFSFFLDDD